MRIQVVIAKTESKEETAYFTEELAKRIPNEVFDRQLILPETVYEFDYAEFCDANAKDYEQPLEMKANQIADHIIKHGDGYQAHMKWSNQEKWSFVGWLKLLAKRF